MVAVNVHQESALGSAVSASRTIRQHIAHELRLQLLRATFAADVESAFQNGKFLLPRGKVHHRDPIIAK